MIYKDTYKKCWNKKNNKAFIAEVVVKLIVDVKARFRKSGKTSTIYL